MKAKKKTHQFGESREKLAAEFLKKKGYEILQNRYKTKYGEIDLVAAKNKTLIFIEVKARKKQELIETILRQKQIERIKNAALLFLSQNEKYQEFDIRFDFILYSNSIFPAHYENYF